MEENYEFNFESVEFEVSFRHPRGTSRELGKYTVMVPRGKGLMEIEIRKSSVYSG